MCTMAAGRFRTSKKAIEDLNFYCQSGTANGVAFHTHRSEMGGLFLEFL